MKNILSLLFLMTAVLGLQAQTMKWVPLPKGTNAGTCQSATTVKNDYLCYALEYTPSVSGTLTSYTTGFLVSCTSQGSPIVRNESCVMANNVNLTNGCAEFGKSLMNSSGNTGTGVNSSLTAGRPVTLHQVCFSVPEGESVRVDEDEVTDLTTSIDLGNGNTITELPTYTSKVIAHPKYDAVLPTSWLDFKLISAGDRSVQLDWSVISDQAVNGFAIERSADGVDFEKIGEIRDITLQAKVNSFQYFDHNAQVGTNYYRIQMLNRWGQADGSPVRWVEFERTPFQVTITPNPATDYLMVELEGQEGETEIRIMDINGKIALFEKLDAKTVQKRLTLQHIPDGVYTVQVKSGERIYTEKISILER